MQGPDSNPGHYKNKKIKITTPNTLFIRGKLGKGTLKMIDLTNHSYSNA